MVETFKWKYYLVQKFLMKYWGEKKKKRVINGTVGRICRTTKQHILQDFRCIRLSSKQESQLKTKATPHSLLQHSVGQERGAEHSTGSTPRFLLSWKDHPVSLVTPPGRVSTAACNRAVRCSPSSTYLTPQSKRYHKAQQGFHSAWNGQLDSSPFSQLTWEKGLITLLLPVWIKPKKVQSNVNFGDSHSTSVGV